MKEKLQNDRVLAYEALQRKIGNVSRSSLWRWEQEGFFPKRIQLGPRRVGWRESDVDRWIAERS